MRWEKKGVGGSISSLKPYFIFNVARNPITVIFKQKKKPPLLSLLISLLAQEKTLLV